MWRPTSCCMWAHDFQLSLTKGRSFQKRTSLIGKMAPSTGIHNRRSVPDYAKQRAPGRRISTAHVESVMNHWVSHRLSKQQQMRWSPEGAHYLLQVRAELLNGTLIDGYRVEHRRFRGPSEFVHAAN